MAMGLYSRSVDVIRELSESADMEAGSLTEYLAGDGAWLPVTRAASLPEALVALSQQLAEFSVGQQERSSDWTAAVDAAYQKLAEVSDGGPGIYLAIERGELPKDPLAPSKGE